MTVVNPADPPVVWQNVIEWRPAAMLAGVVAGTYLLQANSNVLLAAASSGITPFYLDPADYAISGRTLKCRVQAQVLVNSVAPGITFTFHLYPVATIGGTGPANTTVATVGASVANVAVATPGAGSFPNAAVSAEANFPAAGAYVLAVVTSGTIAANSGVHLGARLQARNVP